MRSPIICWDVDTQRDFIDPHGKLYVPGAEAIVPNLRRLTKAAAANGVLVIASACAHRPGDPEFEKYPPHCLVGTPGQRKIPETRISDSLVLPARTLTEARDIWRFQQIILEKAELNVFTNPNIEWVLGQVSPAQAIVVYGVVTEICVAIAAQKLVERGYSVLLVQDAIRALNKPQALPFLDCFVRMGGTLVDTDDALTKLQQRAA